MNVRCSLVYHMVCNGATLRTRCHPDACVHKREEGTPDAASENRNVSSRSCLKAPQKASLTHV
eukprot:m.61345 g.61345  ORF g.61345 m.61345 type:complete len:63 (+) comp15759_c0_seq7:1601-1789(+)